jgi:ABC-type transporter MlaC component
MNKKMIVGSAAMFSIVALAGCGSADLAQQAQEEATKTATEAQKAVQQTNEDYVAAKQEVKTIENEAIKDVADVTKETVVDVTKDVADVTKDQIKQDAEALQKVAEAAGAKFTATMLTKYKNDAAKAVSSSSYANSIEQSSKNGASFVVEVVNQDGSITEVYLDEAGKTLFKETK